MREEFWVARHRVALLDLWNECVVVAMGLDRENGAANYSIPKSKAVTRSTGSSSWFSDPETKRRKRVAKYKLVAVEGKAKQTVRNSLRWLKAKYMAVRYGVS